MQNVSSSPHGIGVAAVFEQLARLCRTRATVRFSVGPFSLHHLYARLLRPHTQKPGVDFAHTCASAPSHLSALHLSDSELGPWVRHEHLRRSEVGACTQLTQVERRRVWRLCRNVLTCFVGPVCMAFARICVCGSRRDRDRDRDRDRAAGADRGSGTKKYKRVR